MYWKCFMTIFYSWVTLLLCVIGCVPSARKQGERTGKCLLPGASQNFSLVFSGTFVKKSRSSALHRLLDTLFHELHAQAVEATHRQSATLLQDDKVELWSLGVVGVENPESLHNAVFLYNGIFLVL